MKRRDLLQFVLLGSGYCFVTSTSIAATNEKTSIDRASTPKGYRLPTWYDRNRVQATTRLGLRHVTSDTFFKAAKSFKEMGAEVFTRHIKTGGEGAWWPSKVGALLPEAKHRNLAKEIIDNAHNEGCHIIVYHRHMEDEYMAKIHPDWVTRDWKGMPWSSRRGDYMCFNSPYSDYLLQRTLELVDLGADGFYYDNIHMPKTGCWCQYCRRKFTQETGSAHPLKKDLNDPLWHKLIDFNNRTIEQTFLKWRQAIHGKNRNAVMLISSNTWPALVDRHLTSRLFRIADSVKTEFSKPVRSFKRKRNRDMFHPDNNMKPFEKDAKLALGYTLCRDAADGRPAHVWTHGLINEISSLYAVSGIVTHGCIANLDVWEETIPNPMFKKAFALGNRVSPYFAGTTPLRWAALHYSEYARDQRLQNSSQVMKEIIYPLYGAYSTLLRARVPVGIITDSQLEERRFADYRILFTLPPGNFSDKMQASIENFRAHGGQVIEQQTLWRWHHLSKGQEKANKAFLQRIDRELKNVPVQVFGGVEKLHAVSYVNHASDRLVISLSNDFSWIHVGRRDSLKISMEEYMGNVPSPCRGVKIVLRGYKKPRSVFEAVSGKTLSSSTSNGAIEIAVPDFTYMSLIVIN